MATSKSGQHAPRKSHSERETVEYAHALGLSSRASGKMIVFLDYDNYFSPCIPVLECIRLCKLFKLHGFELVRTRMGFHAIFWWDMLDSRLREKVVQAAGKSDPAFRTALNKTIRIAGKYKVQDLKSIAVINCSGRPLPLDGWHRRRFTGQVASLFTPRRLLD